MNIIDAPTAYLASPLGATDTSMILQSFVDAKGNAITLAETGQPFVLALKQSAQVEYILCNAITQNTDGTALIGFVSSNARNLDPTSPYAGYSSGFAFDAGAEVMLTNDAYTTAYISCPPGIIVTYGVTPAPLGWLLCNGNAVSRTTYAVLFAIVGTTYGSGDGETTFNVPTITNGIIKT